MTTVIESATSTDATAAQRDVAAAGQLQRMLLPPTPFVANGWTAAHHGHVTIVNAGHPPPLSGAK